MQLCLDYYIKAIMLVYCLLAPCMFVTMTSCTYEVIDLHGVIDLYTRWLSENRCLLHRWYRVSARNYHCRSLAVCRKLDYRLALLALHAAACVGSSLPNAAGLER